MNALSSILSAVLDNLSKTNSYAHDLLQDLKLTGYDDKKQCYIFSGTAFQAAWLDDNNDVLLNALRLACGDSHVKFILQDEDPSIPDVPAELVPAPAKTVPEEKQHKAALPMPELPSGIDPENSFENFVTGNENELASAAAQAMAKDLYNRSGMNPLFIYGPSGIGKTHLLHAIANEVFKKYPDARILYVSGEAFTNDYIDAVKNNTVDEFHSRYRRLNLLLMDDIQFIAGKQATMEEFFHTFNALLLKGCKIALTCDREASAMELDDRLISRFKQGITVDVQPPREAVRAAILQKKAEQKHFCFFPKFKEAFDFITQKITRNVRNLEGALNTLINYIRLRKVEKLSQNELQDVLGTFVSSDTTSVISIKVIQEEVAKFYKIEIEDLCGKSRMANIAYARQVAMYLCLELAKATQSAVGLAFGGRDHGTVINARKRVNNLVDTDSARRKELETLRIRLRR